MRVEREAGCTHASGRPPEFYRVRDLLVDVEGASVSRQGERIVLPPRTFELLVALVRHYPCTVRRPELLDAGVARRDRHRPDAMLNSNDLTSGKLLMTFWKSFLK